MSLQGSLKTSAVGWFVVLVTALCSEAALAQIDAGDRPGLLGQLGGVELNPLQQLSRLRGMSEMVPMEGAVDASSYIVGPGDIFSISIGGPQPLIVSLPVSADGHLTLPEAGAVSVAGRSLEDARLRARDVLRRQFQNVTVEITLAQPRQFYVHVSGAVPAPGRYVATPVARVATVLSLAYADTTRPPVSNSSLRPSLRNVRLIHTDGTSETVDLLRYFSTGSREHNPYMQDGDIVSVPTFDPNYDAVFVSGDVAFPGTYDHRSDDTLEDVLMLATGERSLDDIRRVRVTRVNGDGSVNAVFYEGDEISDAVHVERLDQVHVLLEEIVRGSATIEGWVQYPGTYSIIPGSTTIERLVDLAGGLRPGALERGAYLQRPALPLPEPKLENENRFSPSLDNLRLLRTDTLAIMQSTRLSRMDFLSRAYLAHELRLQNRVPIDLDAMLNGGAETVFLRHGDKLFVPKDENSVFVVGQVDRPGYVTFRAGQTFSHYVAASGGLAENAGRAYVIKAGTGRYVDASRAQIESGDWIFVDRDVMRADTPELQRLLTESRRADLEERSRLVQNIVQAISAGTAIVTTYLLITRN